MDSTRPLQFLLLYFTNSPSLRPVRGPCGPRGPPPAVLRSVQIPTPHSPRGLPDHSRCRRVRPTRGRTWAAPGQWFFGRLRRGPRQEGGRGEGTREGGDGQEKTMKYHARSETGNKDQGIRFTQADAPTLPLQPLSAPQLPASACPRHLRDKDKRLIPATSLETTR